MLSFWSTDDSERFEPGDCKALLKSQFKYKTSILWGCPPKKNTHTQNYGKRKIHPFTLAIIAEDPLKQNNLLRHLKKGKELQ